MLQCPNEYLFMAVQSFRLGIVFTIGFCLGPVARKYRHSADTRKNLMIVSFVCVLCVQYGGEFVSCQGFSHFAFFNAAFNDLSAR